MKDRRIHRIMSLFLALQLCFSSAPIVSAKGELNVAEEVYDNYGREPILPIEGDLDIASTDYYYEVENDSLPGLHGGLDIICAENTEIMAVFDGVVKQTQTEENGGSYGVNVILEHTDSNGDKFYSRYAHFTSYSVEEGDSVSQGQVIGLSGSTGQSYTYHLHLEIYTSPEPTKYERSYTTKYLLSLPVSELERMSFYYHPINGEYNSQERIKKLGSGGSCYSRCGKDEMHDHISKYARYLEKFYNRSKYSWNVRYYFDANAEAGLFSDPVLRDYVYGVCDTNKDGHLSYVEVMRVTTLDLSGLNITSLDGLDIFENLNIGDTDTPQLVVEYKLDFAYVKDAGLLGLWEHIDDDGELPLRKNPVRNNDYAGAGIPYLGRFVVSESCENDGRVWGKTTYNGVEGWVIIGNSAWTRQLTSGVGAYTADSAGRLIYTATGKRVQSIFDATMTAGGLVDGNSLDCFVLSDSFYAWKYNDAFLTDKNTTWGEIIPSLLTGDVSLTLTAVMNGDPSIPDDPTPPAAVYELEVNYRIPLDAVTDAGYAGLWEHTDTDSTLRLRSGHATSYGTVGRIDPDVRFVVTDYYEGSDYLWGKTTYNGVCGWCALDPEWAEQLTSGAGTYTVDSQGYLIYTATGEKVSNKLNSTAKIKDLFDTSLIGFMRSGLSLDGWSADWKYISDGNAALTELVPALFEGDVTLTLDARMTGISGDADGNGTVDERDLDLLVRYLSGYDDGFALGNLDLDGNGKINTRDFILVREMIG